MITLIVWDKNGYMVEEYKNLTLRELGAKLTKLSEEWILVFDTVRDIDAGIGFTMYVTKATKRHTPVISEHMDADMEKGVEF